MQKQVLGALALFVVAFVFVGDASALVQRTFVSGLGSDANPCTRTAPCRTFAAAIAQTQAGGEVVALDTAGYGPVTVTQAISLISPPGVYAGISATAFGSNAITVAAGPNDVVVLKGLSLSGLGLGGTGVVFQSGRALRVEGLTISGFTGLGVLLIPSVGARLTVTDSLIRDNVGYGVGSSAPVGQLNRIAIDGTRLTGNGGGVYAGQNTRATVRDSIATGGAEVGFFAADPTAVLDLENCSASDNVWGVFSSGLVRVAGTTVTGNGTGVVATGGGSVLSRGNNTVEGNDSDGSFTGLFAAK